MDTMYVRVCVVLGCVCTCQWGGVSAAQSTVATPQPLSVLCRSVPAHPRGPGVVRKEPPSGGPYVGCLPCCEVIECQIYFKW